MAHPRALPARRGGVQAARGVGRADDVVDERCRSSWCRNECAAAVTVTSRRSTRSQPASSTSSVSSRVMDVPDCSRLSVLTVTAKPRFRSRVTGWLADRLGGARLHVRRRAQLERDAPVADPVRERAQPVAELVGGDVLDEPHAVPDPARVRHVHGLRDRLDAGRLARRARWRGSRPRASVVNAETCRDGGNPSSAPAMSKPTTPLSRFSRASAAISSPAVGVPHRGDEGADPDRASLRRRPRRRPRRTRPARRRRPAGASARCARCCSGAYRCSAYTTPSAARSIADSRATRRRSSSVCITATVWSNVSR